MEDGVDEGDVDDLKLVLTEIFEEVGFSAKKKSNSPNKKVKIILE